MKASFIIFIILTAILMSACGTGPPTASSDPVDVVQRYLQAKVAGDRDTLAGLICSIQEANLDREALSFSGVKAQINDMVCQYTENSNVVTCSGAIVADYNGENTDFPLVNYTVTQEDGQWKWCGEAP